jgi:hypothetical protein
LLAIGLGPRILALVIGVAAARAGDHPSDLPAQAEVIVAALDLFDDPDEGSTTSGRLGRGDLVIVRDTEHSGWLTIDPPPGSFCWIERSAVGTADESSRARVTAPRALIRSGHPRARMPATPRVELPRGTAVRLLDRPPLALGQGRDRRTWLAIEPPPGDVRHIRASGVRLLVGRETPESPTAAPPDTEIRAQYTPQTPAPFPPPDTADILSRIEASYRAVLREPIERWRFDGIRSRYEELLRGSPDPATASTIRGRLEEVARHETMATDARLIETLLERGRRRDGSLALYQRRLAEARKPVAHPYDVQGLIQPSSRQVEGQRVFALIGRDGRTQAYLDIPPGIDVKGLLTRRVGVRGSVHYNEALRSRLINVRDLEPLDPEH